MSPRRKAAPPPPSVVGVVVAFDEEETIGQTVKALLGVEGVGSVVVVDDGSRDRTAEEAVAGGARVLRARRNLGKGTALEGTLDRIEADVYLLVDADVGQTAGEVGVLLGPLLSGEADLAIGRLPRAEGGGFGLVKRTSARFIEAASGFVASEPLSGQRAITRPCLDSCRPLARGFGLETAMTIDAVRLGFRVVEVEVPMAHRATGRGLGGFAHRAGQGVDIVRAAVPRMLRMR
jgi:hypothetical protein